MPLALRRLESLDSSAATSDVEDLDTLRKAAENRENAKTVIRI